MAKSLFLEFFGAKEHSPDSTSVYYVDKIFKAFRAKHEKNRMTEKEESWQEENTIEVEGYKNMTSSCWDNGLDHYMEKQLYKVSIITTLKHSSTNMFCFTDLRY